MEKHHILDNIPSDLTLEQFQPLVKTDAVLIERIVSAAHVTPEGEWYDQARNEWVMVMLGAARLEFEGAKL